MKRNDVRALHDLTIAELQVQIMKLKQEISDHLLEKRSGKHKSARLCSTRRDDLARMMTIVREKELLAAATA